MHELTLKKIQRRLQGIDIRLSRSSSYKYSYDKTNFPNVQQNPSEVILDVGANIGQSSLWFREGFPMAKIHAFEPLPSVYATLLANTKSTRGISCHNCAIGAVSEKIRIPIIESDSIQTVQVLGFRESDPATSVEIDVLTVDQLVEMHKFSKIAILKTDTEGYDMEVLRGAERQLAKQSIAYILSEVTIHSDDTQHTDLFSMKNYLQGFNYKLYSLYDLKHDPDGRLSYFNALFTPA